MGNFNTLKQRRQRRQKRRRQMRVSLSKFNELLKTVYLPAIREQLNNSCLLFKYLDEQALDEQVPVVGTAFSIPLSYVGRKQANWPPEGQAA